MMIMISATMCSVSKHLICLLLVFSASWSIVTSAITTVPLSKEQVQCSASLSPHQIISRQYNNNSEFETIRCSARLTNQEAFNHPVFDLSFGLTPVTGIFIVRGGKRCSPNKELCWSEFKIPSQALRQLMLPSVEENSIASAGDTSADKAVTHHSPSLIEFTCNVADSFRNSSIVVRCSDTGTIRFAKVLRHGERCSSALNADDECGQNMECKGSRCLCKQGYLPYSLSSSEYICVEKASLGERCNFTRQCTQMNADSLCEYEASLGFRICKCLSGFEEVSNAQSQLYCSPIRPTQSPSSSSSTAATSVESEAVVGSNVEDEDVPKHETNEKDSNGDVEIFRESPQTDMDARMKANGTDLTSLVLRLGKNNQIALIIFGGIILMAILLVAIIIRLRKQGQMDVRNGTDKSSSNGKSNKSSSSKDGPLLGAVHRLSDDEEEIDVHIDDQADDEVKDGQLIYYEQDSEETDIDGRSRQESQTEPYQDAPSSRMASNHSLNNAANFNYSAKQLVV